MLKILSLPLGQDACSIYRVRQPLFGLKQYTQHDTYVIDTTKDNMEQLIKVYPQVDVVYMRPGSERGMQQIQEIFREKLKIELKCKWVLDIDDNTEEISPLSQFYQDYGLEEVEFEGKPLWKDGVNGFSIQNNLVRMSYLQWGLRNADLVTVTTEELATHARKFNDNVYVNDNTIDFNAWWRCNNKINSPLKIIWQGSPSHYKDFYAISKSLNKILKEQNVELYMLGSHYDGLIDSENKSKVKVLPWVSFDAHSYRMMAIQPDIAIIPLVDDVFNKYKSAIKWYEMSAMGLPSLVSNIKPYSEVIDKKKAMPYKSSDEFYKGLLELIKNKGLRKEMGNNAYQWVKKNKNLKTESLKLAERLEKLCSK